MCWANRSAQRQRLLYEIPCRAHRIIRRSLTALGRQLSMRGCRLPIAARPLGSVATEGQRPRMAWGGLIGQKARDESLTVQPCDDNYRLNIAQIVSQCRKLQPNGARNTIWTTRAGQVARPEHPIGRVSARFATDESPNRIAFGQLPILKIHGKRGEIFSPCLGPQQDGHDFQGIDRG